jgi:hypothetical protein
MNRSDKIAETIQNIFYDIKAEALIGDLIENGMENEDFFVIPNGTFKRRYARDISFAKKQKLENGQEIVEININRDALYDTLPEGLFHEKTDESLKESINISEETKKLKAEEKAVRNFFLPFENEIFFQRVQLELEERKILSRFSENLFDDIYPEFWNLDKSLDRKYIYRMVLLLHFSHRIVGNCSLTEKCLETILEEKVSVRAVRTMDLQNGEIDKSGSSVKNYLLGDSELGVDFVCGENFEHLGKTMEFNIGPLKNTNVVDYLENGTVTKFLKCFYNYFIPVELDVKSNIIVDLMNQDFVLGGTEEGSVLGFESAI